MNRSGLLPVACLAFLCATAPALGDAYVELDHDGVLGNGPDSCACTPWGWHPVSVFLCGDVPVRGFSVSISGYEYCLEFVTCSYMTPPAWVTHAVSSGASVVLQAEEPIVTGVPEGVGMMPDSWGGLKLRFRERGETGLKASRSEALQLPARVAMITFLASEWCDAPLTIEEAIYVGDDYGVGQFENNIGCFFHILPVRGGKSTYGAVRELFR